VSKKLRVGTAQNLGRIRSFTTWNTYWNQLSYRLPLASETGLTELYAKLASTNSYLPALLCHFGLQ
jgi:hypothetical protein